MYETPEFLASFWKVLRSILLIFLKFGNPLYVQSIFNKLPIPVSVIMIQDSLTQDGKTPDLAVLIRNCPSSNYFIISRTGSLISHVVVDFFMESFEVKDRYK